MARRCKRRPNKSIGGYSRCPAGTAKSRKTRAERKLKACQRSVKKEHVSKHHRHVCITK